MYLGPCEVRAIFNSPANLGLDITCDVSDWPLSSMMRLSEQLLSIPSQVEQLELYEEDWDELDFSIEEGWQVDLDDPRWLQLLNPFLSVRDLYVSERLGPFVASTLEKLSGESITEVLPRLDNLFFEGFGSSEFMQKAIKPFVSLRQLSGYPVIIKHWQR